MEVSRELRVGLKTFAAHSFYARWQQNKYNLNAVTFEDDAAVGVLDFSKNVCCTQQDEAQSAYYSHTQVTLHPVVCLYKQDGVVVRDSVIFVSDDLKHDAGAVFTFVNQLVEHLRMQNPDISKLYLWSDGCSAQYKSKQPFSNLASKYGHSDMKFHWNFFGSRHEKNASDGESGVVKSKMSRLMIASKVHIDSAKEFAKECSTHLTNLDGPSRRHTYYISTEFIDTFRRKQQQCKAVKGTRKIHSLYATEMGSLMHRSASCFCFNCRNGRGCLLGVEKFHPVVIFRGLCNGMHRLLHVLDSSLIAVGF